VGEAGRAPDTPLTMAAPDRDDAENEAPDADVSVAGVITPPSNGHAGNGKAARSSSKLAGAEPADPSAGDSGAQATGSAPDEGVSTSQEKDEGTSPGQVVRQAVAATNNWFTGRTQKASSTGRPGSAATTSTASAEPVTTPVSARSAPAKPREATRPSYQATETAATATAPQRQQARGSAAPWTAKVATPKAKAKERRNRRQAHLTVARVEPWSVMKFSFVVSVLAFIILFVAVAVLYAVLSSLGVFTSLQHLVSTVTSSKTSSGNNITGWFSASRVLGYTGMLGSLNIVLITAICTIGSVIYNLIARVFGGVEITLRETD